ncbi:MAG TPA: NAD(P)-dependent alcohol dehydrogenase [Anaerolineae bacterium]|jgi:NADPH:quinone reductase-like Zn-dependent oxidoreductase|nr:NAD(P)-dependent alcohol dehydrogenase [Anaerolineae bacterium]
MKAIEYREYGPPDVLQLKEVEKPTPKESEVLIRVYAATVTSGDVNARGFTFVPKGFGPLPRLMFGIRRPRIPILGTEVAGEIEAVGKDVTLFEPGDRVFGIGSSVFGAYAEYVCRPEDGPLVRMPADITYEEAAPLAGGAGTALYFLRDKANVQSGQKILIYGASGGVGTAAVQLAKYYGAEVTGVCSTANLELVKSLGADKVVDYTKEDFTQNGETYDIIYDAVGKLPFSKCKSSLKPNGIYLDGASGPKGFIQMLWTSIVGGKKVYAGTPAERKEELNFLKELVETGKLKAVVDRRYPLEQTAEAHRYVDQGHKKGNVVITVAHNGSG